MARFGEIARITVSGARSGFSHPETNKKVISGAKQPLLYPKYEQPDQTFAATDSLCGWKPFVRFSPSPFHSSLFVRPAGFSPDKEYDFYNSSGQQGFHRTKKVAAMRRSLFLMCCVGQRVIWLSSFRFGMAWGRTSCGDGLCPWMTCA